MINLLWALLMVNVLLLIHEGGHFLAAKRSGVRVEEFGLGYPPRIWGRKFRGVLFSLNLIPFGAFVRIPEEGQFLEKSKIQRALILSAGAISNLVLGWLIFSLLFAVGNPRLKLWLEVTKVAKDSPAWEAGIREEEVILALEGKELQTLEELQEETKKYLGERIELRIKNQESRIKNVELTPRKKPPKGQGPLGVTVAQKKSVSLEKTSIFRAPLRGFEESLVVFKETILGVGRMVRDLVLAHKVPRGVAGPVGIVHITAIAASWGFRFLLQFLAMLNLGFFLCNLFPIPALDGGRLVFIGLETIRGKKINPKIEERVNQVGMLFLIFLMVLITIQDVKRII